MKKRFLALFLALAMCLALLPAAALAADSDFEIKDGVLTRYNGPGGAVTIPNGVTSIVTAAFSSCTGLTSVTIPSSVTDIEWGVFSGCTNLTSFQVSAGNLNYASVEGVLFSKNLNALVEYPMGKKGAYTIPNSVTEIGSGAFGGCTGLTSVIIPDSVTAIGRGAFSGCTGLTSVTIPSSVTSIPGGLYMYGGVFSNCTSLTDVTIPDSVTEIGGDAFSGTPFMENLGDFAVINGILLSYQGSGGAVTIPDGVTTIDGNAFFCCENLTSITIPNSVTRIEDTNVVQPGGAFGCTGLTSVTISDSVTSIGYGAFLDCTDLKDVYYGGTETQWKEIEISNFDGSNECLTSATIHYNSTGPTDQPTTPDQPSNLPTVEQIPATGTAVARTQTVKLDGKDVQFQYYAVKNAAGDETNYVKIRDLAQALNGTKAQFNVGWDGKVSITSNTPYVAVGGEGSTPYSGDQPYRLVSSTPVSYNGRSVNLTSFSISYQGGGYTYYKLRDLGQLLNFNVTWNGSSIVVESDKPYTG